MNDGTFGIETLDADEELPELDGATGATDEQTNGNENLVSLKIAAGDHYITVDMDLSKIPYAVRLHLLTTATKGYITNRLSTAYSKAKRDNTEWDTYDAAMEADPMQNYVSRPESERVEIDADKLINAAVKALYSGELGRRKGTGERKQKEPKDPLVAQITRAVVTDVYNTQHALDPSYKYFAATAKVGPDGLAYLRNRIEERVADGENRTELEKFLENRYLKPARQILGMEVPKAMQGISIL